jgi:hypothetical protein
MAGFTIVMAGLTIVMAGLVPASWRRTALDRNA